MQENSSPTSSAKRNRNNDSVLAANSESRRILENDAWSLSKQEHFAYISILYAREVSGAINLELYSLWSTAWGIKLCN